MAFFAASLVTIVSVVDPVGIAPIFLAVTAAMDAASRRHAMLHAAVIAAFVLFAFAAVGQALLSALGITVPAFSIGGGILLLLTAVEMLFGRPAREREVAEEDVPHVADVSVFPLAVPILSGPGAIATVVLLMSQAGRSPLKIGSVVAAILIALVAAYMSMRVSALLLRLLGNTGVHVIGRVMGILLAALAVQFILNGIDGYYHQQLIR